MRRVIPPSGLADSDLHDWFAAAANYYPEAASDGSGGRYAIVDPRIATKALFSDDTQELYTRFADIYKGRTYRYFANCSQFPEKGAVLGLLSAMIDEEETITLRTVKRQCIQIGYWAKLMGYAVNKGPLLLKDDYHVTYHRSMFDGVRAYYICHSAYEHIWLPEEYVQSLDLLETMCYQPPIGDVRACQGTLKSTPRFAGLRVFRPSEE